MVKGTFSRVKFCVDYESVIRNAKFALLYFLYMLAYGKISPKYPKILQIWSGKKKSKLIYSTIQAKLKINPL